ncbi:MAG: hypothetical protein MUC36_01380 [Planctomycetes bacterium]|jgi:hypothetical protein|nr:hypothetical protein [Planctomycetota bacterium]
MNKNELPIPVRSVCILPRWVVRTSVAVCAVLLLFCLGIVVYGLGWIDEPARRWGAIGGGLGGAGGCLGGLYGTLSDWRRRLPAAQLFAHLQHDRPLLLYRRVFRPAVIAFALGLGLLPWCERFVWQPFVHVGGMLAFLSGGMELIRRHTAKQAHALFALYADGALSEEDAAAIDDARRKDAAFDAEVRAFQALGERVRQLTSER